MTAKHKPTVLIVEDEESLARVLEDTFSREGFEVFTAKDGEKGLEMAIEKKPNAVVLDLILPKKRGQEVLRSIRETVQLASTPVIVTSNIDNSSQIYECITYGAQDYFIKSEISINDLVGHVKKRIQIAA